jgi:hypothetical protein
MEAVELEKVNSCGHAALDLIDMPDLEPISCARVAGHARNTT